MSPWPGNNAPQSNASGQGPQEIFDYGREYIQQPAEASQFSHGPHDPRIGIGPLLSGQAQNTTSIPHPGQFTASHHLGFPSDQPVYLEASPHYAITARSASVPPPEGSWQGYTNSLYASPYASVPSYHNSIPYIPGVSDNTIQPGPRLAPMPRVTTERFLDYHPQYTAAFESDTSTAALPYAPDPDYLQAQSASLYRRRSAPDWATQIDHSELQPDPLSPQSYQITNTPSIFGTFASQTGIPWEVYKCLQCDKVLQDERGLKYEADNPGLICQLLTTPGDIN